MMKHRDDGVGPLAGVCSLVNQIVDLQRKRFDVMNLPKEYNEVILTCHEMASQQIPNIAHFLGVRKYMEPGCIGSLG